MQYPPPNRQIRKNSNYFQQLALTTLGSDDVLHQQKIKKMRIGLDRNALISLAVIFLVVLISVVIAGIYNARTDANALPLKEKSASAETLKESVKKESEKNSLKNQKDAVSKDQTAKIFVYVSGAVNRPGVVEINVKSRINDALEAAGGASSEADLTRINLAQIVNDGEQIHVPKNGENADKYLVPGIQSENLQNMGINKGKDFSTRKESINPKINLNTATIAQLNQIPGVGPATAKEIYSWREKNGHFKKIEDLLQIPRIGEKTLEKLRPYILI